MPGLFSPASLIRAAALASSLISQTASSDPAPPEGTGLPLAGVQHNQTGPQLQNSCNLPPQTSTLSGADLEYAVAKASAAIINYARHPDRYNPSSPLESVEDVPSAFAELMNAKRSDGSPLLQTQSDIDQALSGGYQDALSMFSKSQEKLKEAATAGDDELKTLMMFKQSERNGPGGCEKPLPTPPFNVSELRIS